MDDEIIHVFVIYNNSAWCEAINTFLELQPDIKVIGTSSNLTDAFHRIQSLKPHVVLLDTLPSSEYEYALYDYLDHTIPEIRLLLHCALPEEAVASELNKSCAIQHLPKGSLSRTILAIIREDHFPQTRLSGDM